MFFCLVWLAQPLLTLYRTYAKKTLELNKKSSYNELSHPEKQNKKKRVKKPKKVRIKKMINSGAATPTIFPVFLPSL